jgi:hypothetical protein
MARPHIAIAGNLHWNAGFSHTVAAYVAAAPRLDCEIAVAGPLSRLDSEISRHLPVVDDPGWADRLVIMFEARQFLSDRQREMVAAFPRAHRLVVDFDGHWDPVSSSEQDGTVLPKQAWHELYRELTDLVLMPKVTGLLPAGAEFFKCFGMPAEIVAPSAGRATDYDLQYIGSNWWRWQALADVMEAAIASTPPLRRLRVCGRWWDSDVCPGHEMASANKPGWLRERGVEVQPPVPFGRIIEEMGRALISPLLIRPLVAETGLLTPRMFETLASGSIPVLPSGAEFLRTIFGDAAELLMLGPDPAETLGRIVTDPERYAGTAGEIQSRLRVEYSDRRILSDLLEFLG